MLWYKGWLETRWRFVFALGLLAFALAQASTQDGGSKPAGTTLFGTLPLLWVFIAVALAGAGIKTQSTFRTSKGIHGSMLFTLALPVSRLRLLGVRTALGMLGTAAIIITGCVGAWIIVPAINSQSNLTEALVCGLAISICVSAFYFLSVLLATVLDDTWQMWGSLITVGLMRWILSEVNVPPAFDLFRSMGEASPLVTHALPWASMTLSLGLALLLFLIALRIVQTREY